MLNASQWLHSQNYEAYQAPPPPKKKKINVTLSYPHKIDWHRLTNVWYGLFMGSETLEIYIYTFSETSPSQNNPKKICCGDFGPHWYLR